MQGPPREATRGEVGVFIDVSAEPTGLSIPTATESLPQMSEEATSMPWPSSVSSTQKAGPALSDRMVFTTVTAEPFTDMPPPSGPALASMTVLTTSTSPARTYMAPPSSSAVLS